MSQNRNAKAAAITLAAVLSLVSLTGCGTSNPTSCPSPHALDTTQAQTAIYTPAKGGGGGHGGGGHSGGGHTSGNDHAGSGTSSSGSRNMFPFFPWLGGAHSNSCPQQAQHS